MKLLNLIFIIFISLFLVGVFGLINAYNDRKIERAFKKGVIAGRKYCGLYLVDSVLMDGTIDKGFKNKKVQSITFKYDSIMIINFDSSEVK